MWKLVAQFLFCDSVSGSNFGWLQIFQIFGLTITGYLQVTTVHADQKLTTAPGLKLGIFSTSFYLMK